MSAPQVQTSSSFRRSGPCGFPTRVLVAPDTSTPQLPGALTDRPSRASCRTPFLASIVDSTMILSRWKSRQAPRMLPFAGRPMARIPPLLEGLSTRARSTSARPPCFAQPLSRPILCQRTSILRPISSSTMSSSSRRTGRCLLAGLAAGSMVRN